MFPADHVIGDEKKFRKVLQRAIEIATREDHIVVMGVQPARAETGYGYIETGEKLESELFRVKRFTEKPNQQRAEEFVTAGNYYWNSGIFVWSARTLTRALREHLSETTPYLEQIAAAWGTKDFDKTFAQLYPKCENISIDYAVLEPRSAKGEHSSRLSAFAPTSAGMIWDRGRLYMSITRLCKRKVRQTFCIPKIPLR